MRPWIPFAALALALSPLLVLHPVRVSGPSMAPTLADGELRWALRAWASGAPQRNEIWIVAGPQGPAIKRILGLPGDVVTWRGPELWINGQRHAEPWVTHPERAGQGQQICGDGYLVLGDNRPESQDGRSWGPLPPRSLKGRVL
jgi:signal peptidase I